MIEKKNNNLILSAKCKIDQIMPLMTVYHGGYEPVVHPEIRSGKFTKDFGPGFYCTVIREQAVRWARRFQTGTASVFDLRLRPGLRTLEFPTMTEEWLDFIVACRSGVPHDHDLVIGPMADDQIYNYIQDFLDGTVTREQFWVLARFRYPTHQIAFCTDDALKCLTFRGAEEV